MGATDDLEILSSDVSLQWLDNQQIAVFVVNSSTRPNVDAFCNRLEQVLQMWRLDRPLLIAYDARRASILSPYLRIRSQLVAKNSPDREGRAAFILSTSPLHQAMGAIIKLQLNRKRHMVRQIFYDYEAALAWLREGLR